MGAGKQVEMWAYTLKCRHLVGRFSAQRPAALHETQIYHQINAGLCAYFSLKYQAFKRQNNRFRTSSLPRYGFAAPKPSRWPRHKTSGTCKQKEKPGPDGPGSVVWFNRGSGTTGKA